MIHYEVNSANEWDLLMVRHSEMLHAGANPGTRWKDNTVVGFRDGKFEYTWVGKGLPPDADQRARDRKDRLAAHYAQAVALCKVAGFTDADWDAANQLADELVKNQCKDIQGRTSRWP